ncbi:MAG: Uma2 family endonuclease [Sphingobium sp.]
MSALPKPRKLTVQEYFELDARNERRSEFFDGEMFMMAGTSWEHNIVVRNLAGELYIALRNGRCRVFFDNLRVKVDRTGLYTYPDLLIVCDKPEFAPENKDTLTNPKVVIEVLSESTERYDRTTKYRHYQQLPSLAEYVLVAQDEPSIERYVRQPDGSWNRIDTVGLDATLELASVPLRLPLADVYRDVEFPPPSNEPANRTS